MGQKRATLGFAATGIASLMLLVALACKPALPSAEVQAWPTPTSTPPTDASAPTEPLPTANLTEPETLEKAATEPFLSSTGTPTDESDAEKAMAAAKADLMRRLGLTEEAITVKSVEEVQWRDTSLGCPQPGMTYAQVMTPGFRVILEAGGKEFAYHTDRGQSAVLCWAKGPAIDPEPLMPIAPHGKRPAEP